MEYEMVRFVLRDEVEECSLEQVLNAHIFDQLAKEPAVQKGLWGLDKKNPKKVVIFVHWDSVEAHGEFQRKE
jgi:hypothetical protein